jgi:hypothetical protein
VSKTPTRYRDHRDHPLYQCTQEILDAARGAMQEAVDAGDVSPRNADPIADMIVMDLMDFFDIAHLLGIDWKDLTAEEWAKVHRDAEILDG